MAAILENNVFIEFQEYINKHADLKMTIVGNVIDGYNDFWDEIGDPRVKGWFMMSSPLPALLSAAVYILVVTKIGPKLMENRKPFQLKNALLAYNIFQIIISTYLFYKGCVLGWLTDAQWFCEPVDYSLTPKALDKVYCCWLYFILKHIEFLDTIFFVLRKKNNQITTLHIFHHSYMAVGVWFGVKVRPGGTYSFFGWINSFVHIIMYGYYLLAAMGPSVQKYLYWKKYLTTLQIGQFVLVLLHLIPHLFIKDCDRPVIFIVPLTVGAIAFIVLFANYYRKEYMSRANKVNQQRDEAKSKSI